MANDWIGQDEKLQSWMGGQQTSVTKAMMAGGGPLKRAFRGGMAYARSKAKSPWAEDDNTEQAKIFRGLSKSLRLFGKTKQAEWVDRFTARTVSKKEQKAQEKKQQDQMQKESMVASDVKRELNTVKGSLVRIESNLGILNAAVMDTRDDVGDIKKMLMPTNLVASGEGEKYGEQQFVQYNPLAPKGSQFLKQQTLDIEGEPVRGKLINRAPDEEFIQSAIRMAAVETASTVLRIQRKDEKKKSQIERRRRNLANDTWAYSDPTEPDRDFFKKFIDDAGGQVETVPDSGDSLTEDLLQGTIGGAIGATLPGALTTALSTAGGILVPALTAALPLGIMYAFSRFAETADINNPGKNPIALIGHYGLKWSEILNGETVEEARKRRVEEDRALLDRAAAGELPLEVALQSQSIGRRAPGASYPGDPNAKAELNQAQIDMLNQQAQKFRDMANDTTDEAQRQIYLNQAKMFEDLLPTPVSRTPDDPKTVKDFIVAGANRAGMDPRMMMAMAAQESGFRPNAEAGTSSAKGLFQFINDTWLYMKRKYGGEFTELDKGPFDPEASALAGALYARENAEYLKGLGLPVTPTSLYTAHFLGPGGARKLLEADPNMKANELLPAEARSNPGMFMKTENGVKVPRTVGELQQLLYEKIGANVEKIGYQLQSQYGYNYNQYGTTPRWNADMMDNDSRMVAQDHRGGAGANAPQQTFVTNVQPARTPPPPSGVSVPKPTGLTSDDTLRGSAAADSVLPALS